MKPTPFASLMIVASLLAVATPPAQAFRGGGSTSSAGGPGKGGDAAAWAASMGGTSTRELNAPYSLAIGRHGNLWMASAFSGTVTKFSPQGTILAHVKVGAYPSAITVDHSGNIWTANTDSGTVSEVNQAGVVVGTYAVGHGSEAIACAPDGNIWVAGGYIARGYSRGYVTRLAPDGRALGTTPIGGSPMAIAFGKSGNAWIALEEANGVAKIAPDGRLLGNYNVGNGPSSIAVLPSGNILVSIFVGSRSAGGAGIPSRIVTLNQDGDVISVRDNQTPFGNDYARSLSVDSAGNVWAVYRNNSSLVELRPVGGALSGRSKILRIIKLRQYFPWSIAIGDSGSLYVAALGPTQNVIPKLGQATDPGPGNLGIYQVNTRPYVIPPPVHVAARTTGTNLPASPAVGGTGSGFHSLLKSVETPLLKWDMEKADMLATVTTPGMTPAQQASELRLIRVYPMLDYGAYQPRGAGSAVTIDLEPNGILSRGAASSGVGGSAWSYQEAGGFLRMRPQGAPPSQNKTYEIWPDNCFHSNRTGLTYCRTAMLSPQPTKISRSPPLPLQPSGPSSDHGSGSFHFLK